MGTGVLFFKTSLPASGGIDVEVWVKAGTTFQSVGLGMTYDSLSVAYDKANSSYAALSWFADKSTSDFVAIASDPISSGSSDLMLVRMHFNVIGSVETATFLLNSSTTSIISDNDSNTKIDLGDLPRAVVGLDDASLSMNFDGNPADAANPGEIFKDFVFDVWEDSADPAYFATIHEAYGPRYLFDDDGGGLPNRWETNGEWGKIEYGADNTAKFITLDAAGIPGERADVRLAFDADGKVVGLYLIENHMPTGSVTISGTAKQGETLTASNTLADVDGLGPISYQWKANGTDIGGATGNTLVLAEAQVGKSITVTASYEDGKDFDTTVTSAATADVENVNDQPTGVVTVTGTAKQGETLTASNTLADADGPGTIGYQWKADGAEIVGATDGTLVLTEAQVGKKITAEAKYTDGHGTVETVPSAETAAVENMNDQPTGGVMVTGTAKQGETLTASNTLADADGLGTIGYQWKADGAEIVGATGGTLVLTEAQVGKKITAEAKYTDSHGTVETVPSAETAAVENMNDQPTGGVTISGTATKGQTLTANNTLSDADGLGTISYQWKASGIDIVGATGNTLLLTSAQIGQTITVALRYTDGHGTVENASSGATAAVSDVNDYAPVVDPVTYAGSVAEHAPAGIIAGADVNATDADENILLFSLVTPPVDGDGHALFSVNSSTGQVSLTSEGASALDFETKSSYQLTVAVDDGDSSHRQTANVTVTVTDANDAPTVANPIANQTATEDSAFSYGVPADTFADVDNVDTLTYSAKLANETDLPSWLSFDAATRTFSGTPLDEHVGSIHVKVTATDESNATVSDEFVLTVANVNDAPTVAQEILDQSATEYVPFSYTVPLNTFVDDDDDDTMSFSANKDNGLVAPAAAAMVADGSALPTWLVFDANTRTFSGTPTHADVGSIDVRVTATDGEGASDSDVFTLTVAADTTAPTATFAPVDGATGVAVNSNILVTFSEDIQLANASGVVLHESSATGTSVAASVSVSADGSLVTIDPTSSLANNTHYYVTFADGSVLDLAGNSYGEHSDYDFTTVAATDPYAGHGDGGGDAGAIVAGVIGVGILAFILF